MHRAFEHIIANGSFAHGNGNVRQFHDGAVGELDFLNAAITAGKHVGRDRHDVCKLAKDCNFIPVCRDSQNQIVPHTSGRDIRTVEIDKANAIAGLRGLLIINDDIAKPAFQEIDILPAAPARDIAIAKFGEDRSTTDMGEGFAASSTNAQIGDAERGGER